MYYTGLDPRTMRQVYVPRTPHEKAMQRALIQYRNPKNYDLVVEALTLANRTDLIGFEKHCLIRPKYNGKNGYGNRSESKHTGGNKHGSEHSTKGNANKRGKANKHSSERNTSKNTGKYSKNSRNNDGIKKAGRGVQKNNKAKAIKR